MVDSFGVLLRKYRAAAGISMGELARRVNYSRSYLSKLENGRKPPNVTLARLCDGVLDAGGALIEAVPRRPAAGRGVDRRRMLVGASAMLGIALAGGPRPVPDERVVTGLRASFEQLRVLGRQTSPAVLLESAVGQARAVHALAWENPEPMRSRLLLLAARIAEYTGWLSQESGDDRAAVWWTRQAAELGAAGGDRSLARYALVREAGVALYRQDPISTIELARRAQESGGDARIRGLAARREAQGHALAGDRDSFARAMDRAAALVCATVDTSAYPVLGCTASDPVTLARGWSLVDLGCAAEAAVVLDKAVPRLHVADRRGRARFGVRRSLAHALAGDLEESCRTLAEVLGDAEQVDSATVRLDLRELARTLSRARGCAAVRDVYPELSRVLWRC
jgi:transcriptional regulator with XRE-family HTH domain